MFLWEERKCKLEKVCDALMRWVWCMLTGFFSPFSTCINVAFTWHNVCLPFWLCCTQCWPAMEMAGVLEEASFSLTTKVTVISSASYLGLYVITQLYIIKAISFFAVFLFSLFFILFPFCLFWNAFWANSLLEEECDILLHWLINIYACEQHKALFWMLSHFTLCWLLAWSLYLENTVYYLHAFLTRFPISNGSAASTARELYCNIFNELSGYLKKAKWKLGSFFSRCISTF